MKGAAPKLLQSPFWMPIRGPNPMPIDNHGGSISAEHGIGFDKKPWLQLCRSKVEIATMRRKGALDPKAILNRGRIFD
jgi:FAD/FMN-containing dehydrogenase